MIADGSGAVAEALIWTALPTVVSPGVAKAEVHVAHSDATVVPRTAPASGEVVHASATATAVGWPELTVNGADLPAQATVPSTVVAVSLKM